MRREDEIDDRLEWAKEKRQECDESGKETLRRHYDGWVMALEWVKSTDPMAEKFGKRFETCPVKGVDCDEGPFYGMMLLAHMKEAHPDAYDAVTVDDGDKADA